jgi:hypothetical protein
METKKRILRKMAFIGLIVFAISGLALLITSSLYNQGREQEEAQAQQNREKQVRKYRAYLAETAKKINKLPVDPHILGNAQARFFDEYREARLYLWAMDTRGQFLFGVPEEAFARLNKAYDKYQAAIQEEGRFADRQEFIRRLVQDRAVYDWSRYVPNTPNGMARVINPDWDWFRDEGRVFSAPFESEGGEMLGNLYLKVVGLDDHSWYDRQAHEGPMAVSAGVFVSSIVFLWFLLPTWVYLDARGRGMNSPALWSALTLVSLVFGLAAYLIVRPEDTAGAVCPKCGRTATGGTYCAYCGTPVASEFCQACGYPTRPEWLFCPNCQASLKTRPDEPPAPDAAPAPAE